MSKVNNNQHLFFCCCFISRFRIDEHYVGEPPAVEITITNMNDNVDENFLRNLLQKCGPTEEQIIYRHPRTQRRLGIARIVFIDVKSARACIDKYNQQSVMGNVMNVFHDAFGEQCKHIILEASGEKKPSLKPSAPPPQQQPPPPAVNPPMPSQPPVPPMPPASGFPSKDDVTPHLNESDPYYDYGNSYARSGHSVSSDHKPDDSDWNDSRDKYDEYGYEATEDYRHYRYDKKDSRRWDSKPSRYHKSDKDRERRSSDWRDYRSHRDERDREISSSSSRRREYDYDRKDRDGRERRDRDHRSRDSKYRDYKKSERDYMPPLDTAFPHTSNVYASTSSHHHSSHHYSAFESASSTSFHQYPPLP